MNTFEVIEQRRSIRKFKDTPVSDELIEKLLHAATLAPSGKNRQPWRFVVVKEDKRDEMMRVMWEGLENCRSKNIPLGSSEHTARIMEQAPVTIFVFNVCEENSDRDRSMVELVMNSVDVQSVGAAIQNMLLAAEDLGLGTLWICDVFSAYQELCTWLGETHQMIAAVSIGYPDISPSARPRKPVSEVTTWL